MLPCEVCPFSRPMARRFEACLACREFVWASGGTPLDEGNALLFQRRYGRAGLAEREETAGLCQQSCLTSVIWATLWSLVHPRVRVSLFVCTRPTRGIVTCMQTCLHEQKEPGRHNYGDIDLANSGRQANRRSSPLLQAPRASQARPRCCSRAAPSPLVPPSSPLTGMPPAHRPLAPWASRPSSRLASSGFPTVHIISCSLPLSFAMMTASLEERMFRILLFCIHAASLTWLLLEMPVIGSTSRLKIKNVVCLELIHLRHIFPCR
jgi:hypothetical protein